MMHGAMRARGRGRLAVEHEDTAHWVRRPGAAMTYTVSVLGRWARADARPRRHVHCCLWRTDVCVTHVVYGRTTDSLASRSRNVGAPPGVGRRASRESTAAWPCAVIAPTSPHLEPAVCAAPPQGHVGRDELLHASCSRHARGRHANDALMPRNIEARQALRAAAAAAAGRRSNADARCAFGTLRAQRR